MVQPGTVLDAVTKAAAPYGLRFGPDPSTHSRATIGGAIGNNACGSRALRYGRSADNVAELDVVTGAGVRFTARRYGPRPPGRRSAPEAALLTGLGALADGGLARHPHRVRPVHPAGLRLLAGAPAAGERVRRGQVPVRHRGHPGAHAGRDRARWWTRRPPPRSPCSATPTCPPPPTPCPRCCRTSRSPWRAWTPGWSTWSAQRLGAAAVPDLPRGGGWLFAETSGATAEEAAAAAGRLVADAGCLDSAVITGAAGGRAVADPRGRRRARRPHAGRRAGLAGLGGLRGAARLARALPARAGRPDGPARRGRPDVRALRRRLRARADRLPAPRPARGAARVHRRTPPSWPPPTAARCPASTATAAPAASCCR